MIEDQQTHEIPKSREGLAHIACFMGFDDVEAFSTALRGELDRKEANRHEARDALLEAFALDPRIGAGGAPEIRHVAIDPNQAGFSNIALQLVDEAGLRDHLEFYEEPSEMVLPRLLADRRRFDFAFVDGNHRFDWVFVDLIYLGRLLRGGAVIFLDDYQLSSIGKAVAFCVRNLGWSIEEEGTANEHHHWVALRTPLTPLQRDFDFFVDF